ncbi:MAG: TolC family protein [Saprospiraceae bacterium]|nr:TolC family protein [Saprospiraceae bacterium]
MKCKTTSIIVFALFMMANTQAQSSLESVLRSVEQQNKSLIATQQFWESRKLEYTTGLTLPNPTIQGQYLFGSPAIAGDQTDLFVVQSFDFPTVYKQRRDLAKAQGSVSSAHIAGLRQEILLETKLVCIDLVYRLKLDSHYHRRFMELQDLLKDFQQKLDEGDATILDLNKAKLQVIERRQLQTENQIDLEKLRTQLVELNGGKAILFADTLYPEIPVIPPFDQLEKEVEAADPLRMVLEQERYISEKQLNLAGPGACQNLKPAITIKVFWGSNSTASMPDSPCRSGNRRIAFNSNKPGYNLQNGNWKIIEMNIISRSKKWLTARNP